MTITSPILLAASLLVVVAIFATAVIRRAMMPRVARIAMGIGLILLALGAGGANWKQSAAREVVVMVDLSPSTRGASYRDPNELRQRMDQLLGATPRRVLYFDRGTPRSEPFESGAETTVYAPPSAEAIVLFSDGRFDLPPVGAPTHVVIDRTLETPSDASVNVLELRNDDVAAMVGNSTGSSRLNWLVDGKATDVEVSAGEQTLLHPLESETRNVIARFEARDLWPENDSLSIDLTPPMRSQRWWISSQAPPEGWTLLSPSQLPQDINPYLAASMIVLDNISADAILSLQQQRLAQYVRELGGVLVIVGGDRAFAAGGYANTTLDPLSPLASTPPEPTSHWLILVDRSGSMAAQAGDSTRWTTAVAAVQTVLTTLPPDDLLTLYSFARDLKADGTTAAVRQAVSRPIFASIQPQGPTNLEPALNELSAQHANDMPKHLLLLTDGQSQIDRPNEIVESLKRSQIHLHLLAIGEIPAEHPLRAIVASTGGRLVEQSDPRAWTDSARDILRRAQSARLIREPRTIDYTNGLSSLPRREVQLLNQTWLRERATALATTSERNVAAARWQAGAGEVVALAFTPNATELQLITQQFARAPRDPRFTVYVGSAHPLRVRVEARDGGKYLNDLPLSLRMGDSNDSIPQVGPGAYEISIPAPRASAVLSVLNGNAIIDQRSIAGRYAAEFDAIGNDRAALRELAQRTGGSVIEPDNTRPIDFRWPAQTRSLTSLFAIVGAIFIALGLIHWRLR